MLVIISQETGRDRIESSGRDDREQETPLIFLCGLSEELRKGCSRKVLDVVGWRAEKTREEEGQMGLERVLEWAFLGEGQGVKSGIGRNGDR